MPHIAPPGGVVDWPIDEGTIGVIGVAPWSTLDFLKALYAQAQPTTRDWHFPRVIVDVNTKLPSRGRHLELGETDPSPFIAETIRELAAQGATVVAVPCNTAHVMYESWSAGAPVPVPSIIDATVAEVVACGARRVASFSSAALRQHRLYDRALERAGVAPVDIGDAGAALVRAIIESVKRKAGIEPALWEEASRLMDALAAQGVDAIVLGCTELAGLEPLALDRIGRAAESNRALAGAVLRAAWRPPTAAML